MSTSSADAAASATGDHPARIVHFDESTEAPDRTHAARGTGSANQVVPWSASDKHTAAAAAVAAAAAAATAHAGHDGGELKWGVGQCTPAGDYRSIYKLGEGGNGLVFLGQSTLDTTQFKAIKVARHVPRNLKEVGWTREERTVCVRA